MTIWGIIKVKIAKDQMYINLYAWMFLMTHDNFFLIKINFHKFLMTSSFYVKLLSLSRIFIEGKCNEIS